MSDTKSHEGREERFVSYLEGFERSENRAALAALRRSLGKPPGESAEVHRYILPFQPQIWEEDAYYLVGSLFALHPTSRHAGSNRYTNMGASFAFLKASQPESESIEKRFAALLNSHDDDLNQHLRHAVSLLKSNEIPVDWVRLLKDLRHWAREDRSVQRHWARAFWGQSNENIPETSPASDI